MIVHFYIPYYTQWGESLFLSGNLEELGNWDEDTALEMTYTQDGWWTAKLHLSRYDDTFRYRYLVKNEQGEITKEWGRPRELQMDEEELHEIICYDKWFQPSPEEMAFFSSAFTEAIFQGDQCKKIELYAENRHKGGPYHFRTFVPWVPQGCVVAMMGTLTNWEKPIALGMNNKSPLWECKIPVSFPETLEYKYVIYDPQKEQVIAWEAGENRHLHLPAQKITQNKTYIFDGLFRREKPWKGAGVAIPVFSLRSQQGLGIGEFNDLINMIDWASKVGLKMIQILPVNDTTATYTWVDSYPYAAISVYALHPVYASLDRICAYYQTELPAEYLQKRESLNTLSEVDYEEVIRTKMKFFQEMYDEVRSTLDTDQDYQSFCRQNGEWLKDYAAFSYLRDIYQTANFHEWRDYQVYHSDVINDLLSPESDHYNQVRLYYFIQYHLHIQLKRVSEYARKHGIVLKGDIPIGIYRYSVDAWVAPHLFYMDSQAGAPPDYFSRSGQNWGFPTYNWERMATDGYSWWRKRLSKMADYFDAYRIDHVLGFFRIWEIPCEMIDGTLGYFYPALPFTEDELRHRGLPFEYGRFCLPYIRRHVLNDIIPDELRSWVEETFLIEDIPGYYHFKLIYRGQRDIRKTLKEAELDDHVRDDLQRVLFDLMGEVLLIEDPKVPYKAYNPRFALHDTRSYQELDDYSRAKLIELYNEYFYHRHEEFWREQGMIKLPAIVEATEMLVCAEDLGMVPRCVPSVLRELGILGLEIQRMPKQMHDDFVHKGNVSYLSVFSPSSHDIAPIRAWWEQHRADAQKLYNNVLGKWGEAPYFCEPWIVSEINRHHLEAPSMWTVIPIQDILGMDGTLRREDPFVEQINDPSNAQHYWRYRMHIQWEELVDAQGLNDLLTKMIENSHRNTDI